MPRTARVAPGGMIFHVLNRGNARDQIFHKEADFLAFENVMAETMEQFYPGPTPAFWGFIPASADSTSDFDAVQIKQRVDTRLSRTEPHRKQAKHEQIAKPQQDRRPLFPLVIAALRIVSYQVGRCPRGGCRRLEIDQRCRFEWSANIAGSSSRPGMTWLARRCNVRSASSKWWYIRATTP